MKLIQSIGLLLILFTIGLDHILWSQTVYKRMADDILGFQGSEGPTVDPKSLTFIAIGFFAPSAESNHPAAGDFFRGAQLGIEQANLDGGYCGKPFRLVQRWADKPWAAGSKEVVRLVYEDKVWAIVSFREGASHIAQQIAVKARVPVVAPISSVVSLTSTGVPWIFRLPPDDKIQARLMVKQWVAKKQLERVGLISNTDHDSRGAASSIEKAMLKLHNPLSFHLKLPNGDSSYQGIVKRIQQFRPDGMFLCAIAANIPPLIKTLSHQKMKYPLILPWVPGININQLQKIYPGELVVVKPFAITEQKTKKNNGSCFQQFSRKFKKRFNCIPGHSAAYAFDAVQMIVLSIKAKGLNRPAIRRGLAEFTGYRGLSGQIHWNNNGSNQAIPIIDCSYDY